MSDKTELENNLSFEMTREDLAALGRSEVAYVRSIDADEVMNMLGEEMKIPSEAELYCLYMADGTPVSISDSREGAAESAEQHDLMTIAVH